MIQVIIIAVGFALLPSLSWACASCGCTTSSDWEESSEDNFRLDLRYDYVNQNQLRSSTSIISPSAASQLTNAGNPQEVELYTLNNYLTGSAEYLIDPGWKISLVVPFINRTHSTLGTDSNGTGGGPGGGQYNSNTSSLGDIKVLGRFQGFTPEHILGVILGFKLPTGNFMTTGASTDPTAPGPVNIDRGLQPGTGTTDLILGSYYNKALNKNWDAFGELLYQSALNSVAQYRPGDGYNLNLGVRYFGFETFSPQLQINSRYVQNDGGANADTYSTGGTLIYFSPGVTVPVALKAEIYSFVQLPIYQYLNGVQLAPIFTASVGVRYSF